MNSSITDKLPIESIGETISGTLTGPVADSVHRVGELVPDHLPETVADVVNDGVIHGRRFGRHVVDKIPGRSGSSNTKRWAVLGTVVGLVGLALVFWLVRQRRDRADSQPRDDWSANRAPTGATNRVA
jgi:hypothetical protein